MGICLAADRHGCSYDAVAHQVDSNHMHWAQKGWAAILGQVMGVMAGQSPIFLE